MSQANRWMHLRHSEGFTPERFSQFRAQCSLFRAYTLELLAQWALFFPPPAPSYEFFEPLLEQSDTVATLPLGGAQTLGSRSILENLSSYMLWQRFPPEFIDGLEEGLTEELVKGEQVTNWRTPSALIVLRSGALRRAGTG